VALKHLSHALATIVCTATERACGPPRCLDVELSSAHTPSRRAGWSSQQELPNVTRVCGSCACFSAKYMMHARHPQLKARRQEYAVHAHRGLSRNLDLTCGSDTCAAQVFKDRRLGYMWGLVWGNFAQGFSVSNVHTCIRACMHICVFQGAHSRGLREQERSARLYHVCMRRDLEIVCIYVCKIIVYERSYVAKILIAKR
jgi:hypothetical protein